MTMKLFVWVCERYLLTTICSMCAEKPKVVQKQFAWSRNYPRTW